MALIVFLPSSGNLKIEDKNTSNVAIKNYRLLKVHGCFIVFRIQENAASGQTTHFFNGSAGIGGELYNPQYEYKISGTLELPSGIVIIEGERAKTS